MEFYIIGLEDRPQPVFSEEVREILKTHRIFSGGKRHAELVASQLPDDRLWIDIKVPLQAVFRSYEAYEEIVVFASGDPLFFGFANTIRKFMPEAVIHVYPCFHSLQTLAHRLILPYQDMHMVSLTGRSWHEFDRALIEGKAKIGVLTDHRHTPAAIAERMLEYGYDNYRMSVGEKLGNPEECIRQLTIAEAAVTDFGTPNCLILEKTNSRQRFLGIPEEAFFLLNGRERMITKMPVRLLTLSRLDLYCRNYFWDIGFCTGSVSIEAKLQFPHLHVTAFECREEGKELMKKNSRKFGTPGIETVIADFLTIDIDGYECPDAVFMGGYGGKMEEVLRKINGKMKTGGVLVFNAVSEESLFSFEQIVTKLNMQIEMRDRIVLNEYNPIVVIRAKKVV